jgi:hypothetical protein
MKKGLLIMLMISCVLAGCKNQPTLETVNDEYRIPSAPQMQQVLVSLPDEICTPVMQTDSATIYMSQNYTVSQQIFPGGDLEKTFREVSGFSREELKVMQTADPNADRYDFVWAAAGETEEQACRGCILDDGNYHYVLTAAADASEMGQLQSVWREIFNSFRVVSPQMPVRTGS